MRSSGVTHLLLDEGYKDAMLASNSPADPYYASWERLENRRRERIAELARVCRPLARHGHQVLYVLP